MLTIRNILKLFIVELKIFLRICVIIGRLSEKLDIQFVFVLFLLWMVKKIIFFLLDL